MSSYDDTTQPIQRPAAPSPASSSPKVSAPRSPKARRPLGCLLLTFLLGILVGAVGLAVFAVWFLGGDRSPVTQTPANQKDAIVVQFNYPFLSQILTKNIDAAASELPGQVSNAQVSYQQNNQFAITGDDQITIFGFQTTKHFTLVMQPYVQDCKVQVRMIHADMGGIPATNFAADFEGKVNTYLQVDPARLLPGFTYCATGASADENGIKVSYSAKSLS